MIAVTGLTKRFGSITAVDGLEFAVNRGEIFGIVGPDGAGKSTLLRILAAIMIPDEGRVMIDGIDVQKDPYTIKERIAYMPQRFGLYEDLTVEENIFFFGKIYRLSRREIRGRLDMLYGFSRLGPFKDRLAGKLSGGMKQKLGLACCLVHTPDLLLLDEPTNGVDPVSRREFWDILYDLLSRRVTVVVSTAYLDEAERCNRVALMHRGRFIRLGGPKTIRREGGRAAIRMTVSDVVRAESVLKSDERFAGWKRTGNALRFVSEHASADARRTRALLAKHGVKIISIDKQVPNLEDSFIRIVGGEEGS